MILGPHSLREIFEIFRLHCGTQSESISRISQENLDELG